MALAPPPQNPSSFGSYAFDPAEVQVLLALHTGMQPVHQVMMLYAGLG